VGLKGEELEKYWEEAIKLDYGGSSREGEVTVGVIKNKTKEPKVKISQPKKKKGKRGKNLVRSRGRGGKNHSPKENVGKTVITLE